MNISLRLLFSAGLLLMAASLGCAAEPKFSQDAAAAATRELGAIVERDNARPGHPVIGVTFPGFNRHLLAEASDLDCLGSLPDLQQFKLRCCPLGNAILERVAMLAKLRVLELQSTGVSDDGMRQLPRLTALEGLDLSSNSKITDAGMEHLHALTHLKKLDLTFSDVTDHGLKYLEGMQKLSALGCKGRKSRTRDWTASPTSMSLKN